jgi:23S rRNA (adenine1618-N6)-methyltransferase
MGHHVNEILSELALEWKWRPGISTGVGFAEKAVWSRAARRNAGKEASKETDEDKDVALGFKINLEELAGAETRVIVRWLKGHDSVIFESFCGMMKRRLEELVR